MFFDSVSMIAFVSLSLFLSFSLTHTHTEKLAQTLEIKDQEESDHAPSPLRLSSSSESSVGPGVHSHTVESLTHHIEVQVLESGQVTIPSVSVSCDPTTETTSTVAKDSLSSLQDAQAPPTMSSVPSRRGLSAGSKRRRSSGSNSLSKSVQDDRVEVDGQFDMPIPDSSSSGVATTGSNTVMTFVMTSEGLSQTVTAEQERHVSAAEVGADAQQNVSSDCQQLQAVEPPTAKPQSPVAPATMSQTVSSTDAATQTTNSKLKASKLKAEVRDRTPLIIRRSRVGKSQKMTSTSLRQQPHTTPDGETDVVKSAELSTGNGNETRTPTCREVQIQTQSSPEMEITPDPLVTEAHISSHPEEQSMTTTPRRSTRRHKSSPRNEVKSSSPVRRLSPRKSPVQSSSEGARIRTRAAAKRTTLEEQPEKEDAPPAKRTRRASQKVNRGEEIKHPQRWAVEEVADYISTFQSDATEVFKEHVSVS